MTPSDRSHIGTFRVDGRLMRNLPVADLARIFEGMVIVRCEHRWWSGELCYEAIGPMFEVCPDGRVPLEYGLVAEVLPAAFTTEHARTVPQRTTWRFERL